MAGCGLPDLFSAAPGCPALLLKHPLRRLPPIWTFPRPAGSDGQQIHYRILGLSNLYYIDPEDREICTELMDVRIQLVDLIRQAPESSLEGFWAGEFGDRYWAMVRSGIQEEQRRPEDEQRMQEAVKGLDPSQGGGFGRPGAVNALLVAMLYFKPGTMQVADADQNLPGWLHENYKQIFVVEPAQSSAA